MQNLIDLNERILIAGANGMAGKAITIELKKAGYGSIKNNGKLYTPSRKELDFLDYSATKFWFETNKPTIVIIAAAKVGGIEANNKKPAEFILQNLKIQNNIIESALENKSKRLLFLGSSCIYPKFASQPIDEESLLTGELEPTNDAYAIAKIAGIKLCESLRKQYGFDAISLMPTNLYGPGDNYKKNESHVMAALLRRFYEAVQSSENEVICWGSGKPFREFMHSEDLGRAVVFALEKWNPESAKAPKKKNGDILNYLNVGTGIDLSIAELAKEIALVSGFKGKINWDKNKPDGTPKKQLNIRKIVDLGWNPSISLSEGIKKVFSTLGKELNNI